MPADEATCSGHQRGSRRAHDPHPSPSDRYSRSTFAVAGDAPEVAAALRERFAGLITRISLYTPYETDPDLVATVRAKIRN